MLSSFQHSDHCLRYLTEAIEILPDRQALDQLRALFSFRDQSMAEVQLGGWNALAGNAAALMFLPYSANEKRMHGELKMGT
jgi:hypothetical protein